MSVSFDLTHNLNTTDICGVFAYDIATGVQNTLVSATVISANVLRVTFLVVVAANSTRVIVSA